MKSLTTFLFVTAAVFAQPKGPVGTPEPPMLGPHPVRGSANAHGGGKSPQMTYHGGEIMSSSATAVIFWGTSWTNASFMQDKQAGLDSWYNGFGGSDFARTSDEYTGIGGQVTASSNYLGSIVDNSAAPSRAPQTSEIQAEVCKVLAANQFPTVSNGYYAVYVDTPRGHSGYCAWHSWGSCNGTPIQFAFFFNLDGDAGCDPQSTVPGHSQGLAALANVTAHELSEARTDPRGTGWFDPSGAENADKCSWTFGTAFVTLKNGTQWKLQGNWSNTAYTNGSGYLNNSGQAGCLDGGMFSPVAR